MKILGHECSLETSNGNTYYMKQGFPNRSSFGYCLLQKPLLMTGVAAETLGISCGQDSWQQLVADSTDFVHASFHLLLLSLSSMLSQNQDDNHQLPNFFQTTLHFFLFLLSSFHCWWALAKAWEELAVVTEVWWQLAEKYWPQSWAPFFVTQHCEHQQYYTGCRIFMARKIMD